MDAKTTGTFIYIYGREVVLFWGRNLNIQGEINMVFKLMGASM